MASGGNLRSFQKLQNSTVSRLDTFVRFPSVPGLNRAQLAESGLIYNKSDNSLECVWCACMVTNWPMMSIHSILSSHRTTCPRASSLRGVMEPDDAAAFPNHAAVSPLTHEGGGESMTATAPEDEIDPPEARNEMPDIAHGGPVPAQSRQLNKDRETDLSLHSDDSLYPFSEKVKEVLYSILDIININGILDKLLEKGIITRPEYNKVSQVGNMQQRREDIIDLLYNKRDPNLRQLIGEVLRDPEFAASHVAVGLFIERNGVRPRGQNNWPFYAEDKSIDRQQNVFVRKLRDIDTLLRSLLARGVLNETQAKYIGNYEKPSDEIRALIEIVVCFSITQLDQFASCLDETHPELAKPLKQIVIKLTA